MIIGPDFLTFNFPCGEPHVRLEDAELSTSKNVDLVWDYEPAKGIAELFTLLLYVDALRRAGQTITSIDIPYIPCGRQDRVALPGEPLSIAVVASLINNLNVPRITTLDPHSDVTSALIERLHITTQEEFWWLKIRKCMNPNKNVCLISPDAGALKKIYRLAQRVGSCVRVVECSKLRDLNTGALSDFHVNAKSLECLDCVIVDDICDGGGTFIGIAQLLRAKGAKTVTLCVTHGFFTKGLEIFQGHLDAIHTRKGQVL